MSPRAHGQLRTLKSGRGVVVAAPARAVGAPQTVQVAAAGGGSGALRGRTRRKGCRGSVRHAANATIDIASAEHVTLSNFVSPQATTAAEQKYKGQDFIKTCATWLFGMVCMWAAW